MKYGFIGFGNLAKAIYQGLKDKNNITFAYISKNNRHREIKSFKKLPELVSFSDVIWLCVKPKDLPGILTQFKELDLKNKIIVSPVAGKNINFVENYLGKKISIIRIMPNITIACKKSVTAFFTNNKKSSLVRRVKNDLAKLGKVIELPEKRFDLFTAIFGSGPAFLLIILKVLKNKISQLEISDKKSDDLLIGLITGTMAYFEKNHTQKSIDDLIKNIASKGGTTEAGLKYFKKNNLGKLLENVITTAQNKSKKID